MTTAAASRTTLPERLFLLADPAAVDHLLDTTTWCAVFKAATSDRTFEAWFLVQKVLEPRVDVAVGLIQIPAGRPASDHLAARSGITHQSPQIVLFHRGQPAGHLGERGIQPEPLASLMADHLPAVIGPRVVNERVVTLEGYRALLADFVAGTLPEDQFQWAWLDRLAKDTTWRDDESFALLDSLFENPDGRGLRPARVIAREFQGQLAGRLTPLSERAAALLARLRP